ncbi:hypothetical protein Goari_023697 [Gossypium aridum]|uniref:Uncharacterized protein n=1 Tax=Gossypium aridum TaxID=34290 RepID=A0A7J8X4B1_GOSAI|nr:hypothetical protein [Gossypium aridum]
MESDVISDMVVNSIPAPGMSWRDKVLGRGTFGSSCDEDFEFGYLQNLFPGVGSATNTMVGSDSTVGASSMNNKVEKPTEAFGPWTLVE